MGRSTFMFGIVSLAAASVMATPSRADRAAEIAKLKDQMKTGYVASCVPEAKKSGTTTDEIATTYCKCAVSFVDDLDDSDFLDLVNADLKKERPKNDLYLKMLTQMDTCKKAAIPK